MDRPETLLDFINELNADGRLRYEDYSRLFDLASELDNTAATLDSAKTDIAALLWLNGNCEYCQHGEEERYHGASRWHCKLGSDAECTPQWRGATLPWTESEKAAPPPEQKKPLTRTERLFGPKETWTRPVIETEDAPEAEGKRYKGFLLIRCRECGKLHGFCAKEPIAQYQCRNCGGFTPLHDLTSLLVQCKCGQRFKYRTNLQEDVLTYSCLSCGAPVDLVYNKKAGRYQTVL